MRGRTGERDQAADEIDLAVFTLAAHEEVVLHQTVCGVSPSAGRNVTIALRLSASYRDTTSNASVPFFPAREVWCSPVTRLKIPSGPSRVNSVGYRFGR